MFPLHESRFDGKKTHKEGVRSRQTTWVKAGEAVNAVGFMLTRLGLYGPASRAWDWWLVRDPWLRARTRRLYEPIVRPGDTVIDVGANLGIHTRAFLDLGALVTAYEPNPYCRDVLNNRFWDGDRLRLSGSGICAGTDSRMETFHVCESHALSTFSKCGENLPTNRKWTETTRIYMIPLDRAIDQHRDNFGSLPDYVKIDVEGMDSKIIQSLTRRPRIVSFEMLPGQASATTCAVRHLARELDYRWFAFSEELSYKLTDWVRVAEICTYFSSYTGPGGDLFARTT